MKLQTREEKDRRQNNNKIIHTKLQSSKGQALWCSAGMAVWDTRSTAQTTNSSTGTPVLDVGSH